MTFKVPAPLDPGFRPLEIETRAYEKDVAESGRGVPFGVLIVRNQGYCDHYQMNIFPTARTRAPCPCWTG